MGHLHRGRSAGPEDSREQHDQKVIRDHLADRPRDEFQADACAYNAGATRAENHSCATRHRSSQTFQYLVGLANRENLLHGRAQIRSNRFDYQRGATKNPAFKAGFERVVVQD